MSNPLPREVSYEIIDLLQRGDKLAAIKLYMEYGKVSLPEAKQFIEELSSKENSSPRMSEIERELDEETLKLIYSGQKLAAVKIYRDRNQVSLMEAKAEVERVELLLREKHPERFAKASAAGCAGAAVWVLAIGCAFAACLFLGLGHVFVF